ncbi:MAG TPA: SDR family oxidoreductase [Anaerolineales bacterium]|nr:SDR family oxidoreductase [Anaerolineales bacterium]
MSLENRLAVITGATGGLGSTLARALASHGANLALLDIDPNKLETLAKSLDLPKARLLTQTVDLLDPEAAKTTAGAVAKNFGRIDILLHVVGGWTGGKSLVEAPADDLAFMLNQHVWTSFNVLQAFVPYLVKNGWGRVVMVTSPSAARPSAKGGPYAIGKAGQEALMLTLSNELKGTGVTANLLQAKTIDVKREKVSSPSADNASWTTPEELTSAALYLLSDEAGTINGAKLPLFGSYS